MRIARIAYGIHMPGFVRYSHILSHNKLNVIPDALCKHLGLSSAYNTTVEKSCFQSQLLG